MPITKSKNTKTHAASMLPTLSIVTPSYNQGEYLERAILSVLEQRDPRLRYAVIDGGSTDNSIEIIRKYEKYLAYWCSEPDEGQSAAIVKGFRHVGGDIRGWLNSDDEYVEGAFARVRRAFQTHPELSLVYGERVLIDTRSRVLGWTSYPPFNPALAGYTIASETAFWTAEAEARAGSINSELRFAMDVDFFVRLFASGDSLKLRKYLGKFRCHDESKSATISHIGADETAAIWAARFGGSDTWKVAPKRDVLRHGLAAIRHPRLLAIPYLAAKLSRA